MKWIVLVPGALLPQALAPEILGGAHAGGLEERLGAARAGPVLEAGPRSHGAAHWSWLASNLALEQDPPVTAPYAWRALAPPGTPEREPAAWIAHCDPVSMEVGRDHVRVTDLVDEPLAPEEAAELLALANDAAAWLQGRRPGHAPLPPLRLEMRGGHWFLLSGEPLALETCALDAVLGRSVEDRLPAGPHARELRVLSNEIQMLWHASAANERRAQRGARPVNAVWIHGGGAWRALPRRLPARCLADEGGAHAAVLEGWQNAAAAGATPPATLTVFAELFRPYALARWDDWLARLSSLEACVEACAAEAQAAGARELELVLCGHAQARAFHLAPGPARAAAPWSRWTRRLLSGRGAGASEPVLPRCLGERAANGDVA